MQPAKSILDKLSLAYAFDLHFSKPLNEESAAVWFFVGLFGCYLL